MKKDSPAPSSLRRARTLISAVIALALAPMAARAADIWISSLVHVDPAVWPALVDADQMFQQDAPWQTVAGHTQVMKFGPGNILYASDAELRRAFDDLRRRNIALAVETSLLTKTEHCQQKSEAYLDSIGTLEKIVARVHGNGGDLRYIAMDEPFYYGHEFAGPTACHESAAEIARDIAGNMAVVRRVFPQAEIGDIEVVTADPAWIGALSQWVDAYHAATGEKLAFLHADVDWSNPAMRTLPALSAALTQRGVPFGIIYNASPDEHTDDGWTRSAAAHFTQIETLLRVRPDQAIFQTWVANPTHMLPENQPGTLTNLVLAYLQPLPSLVLAAQPGQLEGRLTTPDGRPVADAPIRLAALDIGARGPPTVRQVAALVPPGATRAVIGIRANSEGSCVCDGDAKAVVGVIRFRVGEGAARDVPPAPSGADAATLALTEGATFVPNLREFPVTPGAAFTLDVPLAASANAERAGYVALIFLDAAGKEVKRDTIWFSPAERDLATVMTDKDGRFAWVPPKEETAAGQEFRASFAGRGGLRPATVSTKPGF